MHVLKLIGSLINHDKKIVAVIVTYNRHKLLEECISALLESDYHIDLLIVNNNSSDGTKDYLESLHNVYKNTKFYIKHLNSF